MSCTFQTLEHIFEVGSFFEALRRLLKTGGRLIVAVPNSEPYLERFNKYATFNTPPHHVGLWNRQSLKAELHQHRPSERIKILAALPFALPLAFAELAMTGRTMAENIAMVFRKPT